jgi:hypothetical protein
MESGTIYRRTIESSGLYFARLRTGPLPILLSGPRSASRGATKLMQ